MTARRSWRIVVHALDRTGPPVLAANFARWIARAHPSDRVEILSMRGGPLLEELLDEFDVEVVLDHHEPWRSSAIDPARLVQLRERLGPQRPVDATLLVSISAGDAIPLLDDGHGPVLTWVVEEHEDYPPGLVEFTDVWLAGAPATADDVVRRAGATVEVAVIEEFVTPPAQLTDDARQRRRRLLGASDDDLLVVGAGIATVRKGPDLFVELLELLSGQMSGLRGAWIGGENDPLFPHLIAAARDGVAPLVAVPSVRDFGSWVSAADIYVHTARFDSLPNAALLAASAGVPVVAFSGAGGLPQLLGATFIGAPYPDLSALAEDVIRLRVPEERRRVGSAQRSVVAEHHVVDASAPRLYARLQALVEEG